MSGIEERFEDELRGHVAAVAGDLDDVLTCCRAGRTEQRQHDLVDSLAIGRGHEPDVGGVRIGRREVFRREQPVSEVTTAHQLEDEAWRVVLEVVAEEWEQVRVAAQLQHAHLTLQVSEIMHARLCTLDSDRKVAKPWRQRVGRQ